MRCIVKGCEKEVFKNRLCEDHYDPEAPQAEEEKAPAKRIRKHTPKDQLAMLGYGALVISGKIAGGLVHGYNKVLSLTREERAEILNHIGLSSLKKGQNAKSVAAFEDAVQLEPGNLEAHFALGHAYAAAERFDKACESFTTVLELNPEYDGAHAALGDAWYCCGEFTSALKHLKEAAKRAPNNDVVCHQLGLTYEKLGAFKDAARFLQKACDLRPRNVKYYYSLGFLYEANGMKDEALQNFKKAMELEKPKAAG